MRKVHEDIPLKNFTGKSMNANLQNASSAIYRTMPHDLNVKNSNALPSRLKD